jgi:hypothetical protein
VAEPGVWNSMSSASNATVPLRPARRTCTVCHCESCTAVVDAWIMKQLNTNILIFYLQSLRTTAEIHDKIQLSVDEFERDKITRTVVLCRRVVEYQSVWLIRAEFECYKL